MVDLIDLERTLFRFLSKSARKGDLAERAAALARFGPDAGGVDLDATAAAMQTRIESIYTDAPPLSLLLSAANADQLAAIRSYDWVPVGIYVFGLPATKTRSGTAESAAHRKLKEWVAANPERVGAPGGAWAVTERWFPSGDESDVAFLTENEALVVEVRPSGAHEHELRQAVFALVKFRAVIEAESSLMGIDDSVRVMLVTPDGVSDAVAELAKRLSVEVLVDGPD